MRPDDVTLDLYDVGDERLALRSRSGGGGYVLCKAPERDGSAQWVWKSQCMVNRDPADHRKLRVTMSRGLARFLGFLP